MRHHRPGATSLLGHMKIYRVSQKSCSTFDEILKNKDNVNKLMER